MTNQTLDHSVGVQITITDTDPAVLRAACDTLYELPDEAETVINVAEFRGGTDGEINLGDYEPWSICGWSTTDFARNDPMPYPYTIQAQTSTWDRAVLARIVNVIEAMPTGTIVDAEYANEEDYDGENSAYESVGDIEPQKVRTVLQCFLPQRCPYLNDDNLCSIYPKRHGAKWTAMRDGEEVEFCCDMPGCLEEFAGTEMLSSCYKSGGAA